MSGRYKRTSTPPYLHGQTKQQRQSHHGVLRGLQRSMRTGRKCKLTDELAQRILDALSLGATHKTACRAASISKSTFYGWLKKGDDEADGLFRDFLDAVRHVEAQRECEGLAHIAEAGRVDWRAEAWYLSRRYPERWGNGKRRIGVKDTEPSVQDTMPMSKEAVALAEAMVGSLERIVRVQAAAWYLSRRYPERWGNSKRRTLEIDREPVLGLLVPLSSEAVALGQAMANTLDRFHAIAVAGDFAELTDGRTAHTKKGMGDGTN
jgi:hypothetical protein